MTIDWNAVYAAAYPRVPPDPLPAPVCTCGRGCAPEWGCLAWSLFKDINLGVFRRHLRRFSAR